MVWTRSASSSRNSVTNKTIATPQCNAPASAYKDDRSFDSGMGDELPRTDYGYEIYRKVGLIPYADDSAAALKIAKSKWGPDTKVFVTARGYVAYKT